MEKIVIIDTGSSNILSLKRAIEIFHPKVDVTTNSESILSSNKIFFPGVGAFKKVMETLKTRKLIETLIKAKQKEIPVFGICLGLQLFFNQSEEFGVSKGLGLIEGEVKIGKLIVEAGAIFNANCSMNNNYDGVKTLSKNHEKTA